MLESARWLSRWCDVYKAEFPGNFGHESDSQLQENLVKLNAAIGTALGAAQRRRRFSAVQEAGGNGDEGRGQRHSRRPGVLEGVFLAGRLRRPAINLPAANASAAIRQVDEIVKAKGTPWFARYGLTMEDLHGFRATENWHFRYGGDTQSSGGGTRPSKGMCIDIPSRSEAVGYMRRLRG